MGERASRSDPVRREGTHISIVLDDEVVVVYAIADAPRVKFELVLLGIGINYVTVI